VEKPSTSEPSPLSPTRWPPDAFAWPRSLAALALVLLAFGAGLVLASVIAVRSGVTQADVASEHLSWGIVLGQLASYVIVVPTLFAVLPWLARRSLADLGLRRPTARALGIAVVGAIAMYAVTIGLAGVQFGVTHRKPEEAATALFSGSHDPLLTIAFGVIAVAIAPFVEELTFRGFLFNVLRRYAPVWLAATLSGLVFGLSHGSPTALVPLAGSGIVLAYVYELTGSLPASMLTHALFNAINLALIAFGKTT
jgi:membrane protease YdiL (CAAX protease family)